MATVSKLRGKFKGYFFVLRLDRLIPKNIYNFLVHMAYLSIWISRNKKKGFTDFYSGKRNYNKRLELFEYVIQKEKLDKMDYLEFGVSKGHSFKWWLERIQNPESRFYGFDTFNGLPEAWGPFKKGDMSNGDAPPEFDDNRHQFYQGVFQQTLIPFLSNYQSDSRKVIHLDADLYSATLYVLTLMTPYIKSGDILFFDEFNVPMHEFKAFKEWTESFYIQYEVLGGVNNYYQTAILIK